VRYRDQGVPIVIVVPKGAELYEFDVMPQKNGQLPIEHPDMDPWIRAPKYPIGWSAESAWRRALAGQKGFSLAPRGA
jgi:hypothetical protein